MKGLVVVLEDGVLAELVDTLAHGTLDRIRVGINPPSERLKAVVGVMTNEYSRIDGSATPGDSGTVARTAHSETLMTRQEAAVLVGRSPATIDRWRVQGLKASHDGRSVVIARTDLEDWMNRGT